MAFRKAIMNSIMKIWFDTCTHDLALWAYDSVMKKYAMPLLEEIETENEHFPVAERLIRMLKFFDDLPDQWVPCNSIIREFIGGSCYQDD